MKTAISHADVLRAIGRVRARSDRSRREVARLLGFDWKAAAFAAGDDESTDASGDRPRRSTRRRTRPLPPIAPEPRAEAPPAQPVSFTLSGPQPAAAAPRALPDAFPDFSRADILVAEPPPLFLPRWTRAILTTALSAFTDSGVIDIAETVRLVASGAPLRRLPRRRVGRMPPATQVLVDGGGNMTPFLADQVRLTADLAHVVGASALEVLKFVGTPLRKAGRGPQRTWPAYAPPPPGTAIVLITDFGIADAAVAQASASVGDWVAFLELLQARGCPAIALVPYGPRRWPPDIARLVPIVVWDRSTTVRHVRFRMARS